MGKATAIMQDTNAACDAGFAANQCDAPCALQMATLVDGDCAKTITGIVDQQDRVPNGLAEKIDAQWARCVRVPAPWPWPIEPAHRASSKRPQKKPEIGPEEKKS